MYSDVELLTTTCPAAPPRWPTLENLVLSPAELIARREGIGGSDANIICSADEESIHRLWLEKRNLAAPEDFSKVLPVALGVGRGPHLVAAVGALRRG